jgi:hypothetical protein
MSYPGMTDYQDVLQEPSKAFSDPVLRSGSVATSPLGLPAPMSGGFVITYRINSGGASFAVRCFHREIPGIAQRYALISKALSSLSSSYFATFDYQPTGILVNGARYPIVKMDWVQGETLDVYLDRHATDRGRVADLRTRFSNLENWLRSKGIAHGDLQNGNVVVGPADVKLVDYDGMFVPGMTPGSGTEVGHKHFQHPGRAVKDFGPDIDRFAFIVLDLSLEALGAEPSLHRRFREGGEAIVFKANDFADPDGSEVFGALRAIPSIRDRADRFAAICGAPISLVPTLPDYLAGRNIPTARATSSAKSASPPAVKRYIGAYPVLSGTDYEGVLRHVGDRIEIVGQVLSVKEGVGRRGRGRGLPYVFINFGIWNQKSVKITIWSDGLSAMSTRPDQSWVGRWLSVTGLVEPPYEGATYGKSYFSVGVTLTSDNQLVQLSAQEAKFRLGGAGKPASAPARPKSSNAAAIQSLGNGSRGGKRSSPTGAVAAPAPQPASSNAALLATLKPPASGPGGTARNAPTSRTQTNTAYKTSPTKTGGGSNSWLGWAVMIVIALLVLARCAG